MALDQSFSMPWFPTLYQDNTLHPTMAGHLDYFLSLVISGRVTTNDGSVSFGERVLAFLLGMLLGAEV